MSCTSSLAVWLASCLGLLFILAPLTQHQKKRSAADRRNAKLAIEWIRGKENASNPNAEPAAVDTGPVAALEELGAAIERDASGHVVKVNCPHNDRITDGDPVPFSMVFEAVLTRNRCAPRIRPFHYRTI